MDEWYEDEDEDEAEADDRGWDVCECGEFSFGDGCGQCGQPLCPRCFELGGGFCDEHPDEAFEGY